MSRVCIGAVALALAVVSQCLALRFGYAEELAPTGQIAAKSEPDMARMENRQ
jgi:hypothetical protein